MPYWVFAVGEDGRVHQFGGKCFWSPQAAQVWADNNLSPNDSPEIFSSSSTNQDTATSEYKARRVEQKGLKEGTRNVRHDLKEDR